MDKIVKKICNFSNYIIIDLSGANHTLHSIIKAMYHLSDMKVAVKYVKDALLLQDLDDLP